MNGRSFTETLPAANPDPSARPARPRLVSATVALADDTDLDALLARFDRCGPDAACWVDGERGWAMVSQGVAWQAPGCASGAPGWPAAQDAWRQLVAEARIARASGAKAAGPALVGGAAFDALADPSPLWAGFGAGRLYLPQIMWTLEGGRLFETRNRVESAEAPCARDMRPDCAATPAPDGPASGARARFAARVEAARTAILAGRLRKVVVARRQTVRSALAPGSVLRSLAARQPGAYIFALAAAGRVFCGATPELLVRVSRDAVESACLAGTVARGHGAGADRRLGERLQSDRKEQEEHDLVRQGVAQALARTCADISLAPVPSVRALVDVQHLATTVRARLRPGFGLLDAAADLHPTPAVAGVPRAEAMAFLREEEGLDRGLYAGPVGFVAADGDGVFAVALRSGILDPGRAVAHLFAGCGIVAASEPSREWRESRLKMRTMAAALGVEA